MLDSSVYSSLPQKPGVYLYKNKSAAIIYVGKAKDLRKRVTSYFSKSAHDSKTLRLLNDIHSMEHIVVSSEIEAFLLEANLIKKYRPFYNIQFKDDKFYPYIKIGNAPFPYIQMTRKVNEKAAEYFGPYTSAESVQTVLKILRRLFPYQSVKNHPKRNCLYYHLGFCPCIPAHPDNIDNYKKNITRIKKFLNGQTKSVIEDFEHEQKTAIKNEEFEQAAEIQKKIERIQFVTSENYDPFAYQEKPDLYYERISKELESLKKILNDEKVLVDKLKRIECYDISNFQGKEATGSMVVFVDGDASKKDYRKFKIRRKNTPDDFAMHQEMMARRLNHLEDWGIPDLLVIDGGKGQVSSVLEVLVRTNHNIPVIGLAKREETIVVPVKTPLSSKLEFIEVKLPKETPGVNLLRRIRDDAHRFAITYHRLLRKKRALV